MIRAKHRSIVSTPTIRVSTRDLDLLSAPAPIYQTWRRRNDALNRALIGTPLPAIQTERRGALFMRARGFYVDGRLVGRALLCARELEVHDPLLGERTRVCAFVGSGGVLPEFDARIKIHTFVPEGLARFHARRSWRDRRPSYLLATIANPITAWLFARSMSAVYPHPHHELPGYGRLRDELVAQLYPELLTEASFSCPPPPNRDRPMLGEDPLLHAYDRLCAGWRDGKRTTLVVRCGRRDCLEAAGSVLAHQLAKKLRPSRPCPLPLDRSATF